MAVRSQKSSICSAKVKFVKEYMVFLVVLVVKKEAGRLEVSKKYHLLETIL